SDGDGICDDADNCPTMMNADQADNDGDGIGNLCDDTPDGVIDPCANAGGDSDGDGICDDADNCPTMMNADQADNDGDGIGNLCDDTPDGIIDPNACQKVIIIGGENKISLSNIPTTAKIEYGGLVTNYVFTTLCEGDCETSLSIDDLAAADYIIKIQTFNPFCYFETIVTVTDVIVPCANAGGDSDGDGICDDADNCPTMRNPDQADNDGDGIGNLCDDTPDGDSSIGACTTLIITGGNGQIDISNIPTGAKIEYQEQAGDWAVLLACDSDQCGNSQIITGLSAGIYNLKVQTFNPYCYTMYEVVVSGDDLGKCANYGGDREDGECEDCDKVTATMANGFISINVLNTPNIKVKIFDENWHLVFECENDKCPEDFKLRTNESVCHVDIQLYTADWEPICLKQITVRADGASSGRSASRLAFTAFPVQRQVALQWATNSGWKNEYFELQKSTDGETFETIRIVDNTTTTDEVVAYTEQDLTPELGNNYYRIKEVRLDGTIEFTNIVQVNFGIDLNQFYMYPNPATDNVNINLSGLEGRKVDIQLISNYGQILKVLNIGKITDTNVQLPLENIPTGMYQLLVKPEGQKALVRRLIVEKMH
ncbi:MAG: T9SS type A sorting domain-containing protein, partial [Saprospiraceae bacterium]